jgi:hypothetical protein
MRQPAGERLRIRAAAQAIVFIHQNLQRQRSRQLGFVTLLLGASFGVK